MTDSLKKQYQDTVVPTLINEFGIANVMKVPKLQKVVVSIALKEAAHDKGVLEKVVAQLTDITGQKPKVTRARLSIANFKLRQGDPIGVTVTLRGGRMWDFVSKLLRVALPRVRDFHGVSRTAFDPKGNYTLGLTEQTVFPEIEYSKIDRVRGLQITLVNNSGDVKIATRFLELLGMPFTKG